MFVMYFSLKVLRQKLGQFKSRKTSHKNITRMKRLTCGKSKYFRRIYFFGLNIGILKLLPSLGIRFSVKRTCNKCFPHICSWLTFGFFEGRRKKIKVNGSISTSVLVLLSDLGCMILCFSNFLRSLNYGSEKILSRYVSSVSFSFFGAFSVAALLNVCFVWVELANTAILNIASHSNMKKHSKRILGTLCCLYFSILIILYFLTGSYNWIAVLTIIYTVCVGVAFIKGASMISRKLDLKKTRRIYPEPVDKHQILIFKDKGTEQIGIQNPNRVEERQVLPRQKKGPGGRFKLINGFKRRYCAPGSPSSSQRQPWESHYSSKSLTFLKTSSQLLHTHLFNARDLNAKKAITLSLGLGFHCLFFCASATCYFIFNNPGVKYYKFASAFLSIADVLCIHLWILHYVSGGSLFSKLF